MKRERIAVIGAGAAGISAAFVLAQHHEVTLFEASSRLGGHAWPHPVEGTELDTAFLIFNSHSYPEFLKFLGLLGVSEAVVDTDMSIGIHQEGAGLRYSVNGGKADWLGYLRFAFDGKFRQMLTEIRRFREATDPESIGRKAGGQTLEEFLRSEGFSDYFAENFAYPLGASVWSLPLPGVKSLPAVLYFSFFNNHKILKNAHGARWQTLRGSSAVYLRAFEQKFAAMGGKIRLSSPVTKVARSQESCTLELRSGPETFDRVLIAVHAEDALQMLAAPTAEEAQVLGAWKYRPSETILHTDETVFPKSWQGWASWNVATADQGFKVTYYLNRIQKNPLRRNYFLSWGAVTPKPERIIAKFRVKHPSFTPETEVARALLADLQGNRLAFAGSYFGNGFHEDAVRSGFAAAARWGAAC